MEAARPLLILVLALSLGSCSDETVGPTLGEFEELCGEKAPIRLLPIDPEHVPYAVGGWMFAERYVFAVLGKFSEQGVTPVRWFCSDGPTIS